MKTELNIHYQLVSKSFPFEGGCGDGIALEIKDVRRIMRKALKKAYCMGHLDGTQNCLQPETAVKALMSRDAK